MGDGTRTPVWHGADYAASAAHHRAVDDWFLARHPPEPTDVVVDLGCGSGEFSARLAELVPDGRVVGVEPDPSMLEVARGHRASNLGFVGARAEELDGVVGASSVDLVVSRAMLHWLPLSSYPRCFDAVRRVLRPGGWYHSESAAAGNVPRVTELVEDLATRFGLTRPPRFPDPGVVLEMVETAGFDVPAEGVRTVAQRRPFTREGVVGLVRNQASVVLTRNVDDWQEAGRIVQAALDEVDRLRRGDGTWDQTFVRLEILARRPGG